MKNLPSDDIEKQEVLSEITGKFEKDKQYKEEEVNEILKSEDVEDIDLFRRELVNFGYLGKDSYKGVYWLAKEKLSEEDMNNLKQNLEKIKGI